MSVTKRRTLRAAALGLIAALGFLTGGTQTAEAGLYDRVKDIFELPGEVDKLKEEYGKVKGSYDDALKELDSYRQMQEKLLEDNARLAEQNRLLAETVQSLKKAEESRSRSSSRIQRMIWTVVLLGAGYVILTRVARYVMRARSRN
ncbi:hypothetical protein [Gorillibacterium sp. sgz5001074]|uniref:hypothetical protein n=1 Tax=Gorillibacterium sp. sgz5001074 TaxID=3446695 RepID=UPI003F66D169